MKFRQEHPNPQCMRDEWVNLNGEWDFSYDNPTFDSKINVPFPWGTKNSGTEINRAKFGSGWYRTNVSYDNGDKLVFLNIGAVYYECDIFVNSTYIGHFFSGFTPIHADVTSAWQSDGENLIIIRATNDDINYQPKAKTYDSMNGIWQSVWLELRPKTYIKNFKITTCCNGEVAIDAVVSGDKKGVLRAEFDGVVQCCSTGEKLTLNFENPKLWSTENPYLYEGKITLETEDGIDTVNTYFGIREIGAMRFDGLRRKYITLNNKPIYINSCLNQSCSLGGHTLKSDDDIKDEVMKIKSLGLNSFRIHIKGEDPRKLYWADKLGMLVIQDMPVVGVGNTHLGKWFYEKMMVELMERDFNHPSIIMWVLFNETWGLYETETDENGKTKNVYPLETQKWVEKCYRKAKSFDGTRIIDDNSVHFEDRNHTVTDVNSWHLYANGYERMKQGIEDFVNNSDEGNDFNYAGGDYLCGDVPVLNCECGNYWDFFYGEQIGVAGDSDVSWQYKYMMNEFRLHDDLCGFVFTEYCDVVNEYNGYFRFDGSKKEFGYEDYVPEMSVTDLHSQDFLAVDCPPMKTCFPGEVVKVPLVVSSFTNEHHGKSSKVKWELVSDGNAFSGGELKVCYDKYGCTPLGVLEVQMPEENSVAVLRLCLTDEDDNIVMRNFLVYDVVGERNTLELADVKTEGKTHFVQNGEKLNCIGDARACFKVTKSQIPSYSVGKDLYLRFEASSKEEITKDRENITWSEKTIGLKEDRGFNPNTYYQTDEILYPSTLKVSVGGKAEEVFDLVDGPADSRGCLSWHYQQTDNRNDEAGSYGYLCEMKIDAETARELPDKFNIIFESDNGFSLYGRRSGRYPIATEIYVKD